MAMFKSGLGSGVSLKTPEQHDSAPQYGLPSQLERALAVGAYFTGGTIAVTASQFLGAPLSLVNKDWYDAWIAMTKRSFGILTTTMTQWWAPTIMRISGDTSVRGQLTQTADGALLCTFPERLIMIANHQIYTDWLYMWWMAYTAGMHGRLYIMLKESLKRLPVIGWGMQFSRFIFLKRNWEKDKPNLAAHLQTLNKPSDPMWLLLFPEGTNLAPTTRKNSKKWAAKNGIKDLKHTLLPRTTGLQFCLQQLRGSTDYVYDCTIAYEGVPRGAYAQDIFTIRASYLEGRPPKSVNMYWRRFPISSIPIDDDRRFDIWLRERWIEKDDLIEAFHRTGRFPADTGVHKDLNGETRRGCGYIETEVRSTRWYEFLQIFAPIGLLSMILYMFYGALPTDVTQAISKQASGVRKQIQDSIGRGQIEGHAKTFMAHPMVDRFLHGEPNPQTASGRRRLGIAPKALPASKASSVITSAAEGPSRLLSVKNRPDLFVKPASDAGSVTTDGTVDSRQLLTAKTRPDLFTKPATTATSTASKGAQKISKPSPQPSTRLLTAKTRPELFGKPASARPQPTSQSMKPKATTAKTPAQKDLAKQAPPANLPKLPAQKAPPKLEAKTPDRKSPVTAKKLDKPVAGAAAPKKAVQARKLASNDTTSVSSGDAAARAA